VFVSLGASSLAANDSAAPDLELSLAETGPEFHASDPQVQDLIRVLLEENPEIRSARAFSQSLFERVPQARSLGDPQLNYRYFASTPETRVGPQIQTLELNQAIPWGGKRRLQAERAEHTAIGAEWRVRDLERVLVAELKRAYYEVAYLHEALTVNAEERELLRRFESIALKRYATGEGIQQSVVKVQTDLTRLDDQETALRERLDAILRRIAELIGRPGLPLTLAPVALEVPEIDYDRAELEKAAETAHPRVRAAEQQIVADETWSRRRTLESRPDFRVGLGYTQVDQREDPAGTLLPPEDNGKDILAVTVGINIPLYRKRIRAGIAEANESLASSQDRLSTDQHRLRFLVQEAIVRLESLEERSRLFEEVLIPQAGESLASAEAAYTTNRLGFLDLLDAERVLFQVRLTYHRLISDFWMALTDLEFATGQRFPR
jgi:outer membrane protein TolC